MRASQFQTALKYFFLLLFFIGILLIQEKYPHKNLKDSATFDFNDGFASFDPDFLRSVSFGYPRFMSSLLWMRFLQHTPATSIPDNAVSWIFLDLFSISKLDPDYMPTYLHGAMYLAVITEDIKGAGILLEEGVRKFPNYWKMRAYLAYHYEQNLHDYGKAAAQYEKAALLPGAPKFFKVLAATMYTKSGNSQYSIEVIERMLESAKTEDIKKRLRDKLKKIKSAQSD